MQPGYSLHYVSEVLKGSNTAALRRNGHTDGFVHWKCCGDLRWVVGGGWGASYRGLQCVGRSGAHPFGPLQPPSCFYTTVITQLYKTLKTLLLYSKTQIERLLRRMVLLGVLVEDTYRQANEFAAVQSAIRVWSEFD